MLADDISFNAAKLEDLTEIESKYMVMSLTFYGLRPSMTTSCVRTRFKPRWVASIYKQIHKTSPVSGQHPMNVRKWVTSDRHAVLVSLAAQMYSRIISTNGNADVDPSAMLKVHDSLYPIVASSPFLTDMTHRGRLIEMIYYVARDLLTNLYKLIRCPSCHYPYMQHKQLTEIERRDPCPHCRVSSSIGLLDDGSVTRAPRRQTKASTPDQAAELATSES